jgi:septal ring factor EnvC (AmiA/AmiB activator)
MPVISNFNFGLLQDELERVQADLKRSGDELMGYQQQLERSESIVKQTQEQLEYVQAKLKCSEEKLKEKELLMRNELVRCVILSALSH